MLTRWDPFREMMTLRSAIDRLFDNTFAGPGPTDSSFTWDLALDVSETNNEFVVKASLPGMNPDDLDITYNAGVLTVRGETKAEKEEEGVRYHLRERRYGTFARSISLPTPVKADAIKAHYADGVLTLTMPKAEEAKPKRIAVQSDNPQMIEGKVANIKSKN
jgi:HSP20 family protein